MASRDRVLKAAALGVSLGLSSFSAIADDTAMPKSGEKYVRCFGINKCKGINACGVKNAEIKLANKVYDDKYKNSKAISCSGSSGGSAEKGHLAWVARPDEDVCFEQGGFVFEKKDDKLVIREKSGIKGA
jgi:hypothetical protein